MRLRKIEKMVVVTSHSQALEATRESGVAAIVERGMPRTVVMSCPDGCGELLTVNVDPRLGKAWRIYRDDGGLTLFPSVWRDTGCESHFVLWDNRVLWGDGADVDDPLPEPTSLEKSILYLLSEEQFVSYVELADALSKKPWSINKICQQLVRTGRVEEESEPSHGNYRRIKIPTAD